MLFDELVENCPRNHSDPCATMLRAIARVAAWETDNVLDAESVMEDIEESIATEMGKTNLW